MRVALLLVLSACEESNAPRAPASKTPVSDVMIHVAGGTKSFGWVRGMISEELDLSIPYETLREPGRRVEVAGFYLDRLEVTNVDFDECVDARACVRVVDIDHSDLPRNPALVPWDRAAAYCAWRRARLPTEIEWEVAARGGDDRLWPWGDRPNRDCLQVAHHGCTDVLVRFRPVGRSIGDVTTDGVRDMFGNAQEWVADRVSPTEHRVRGGTFGSVLQRHTMRDEMLVGFRCARDESSR